MMCRCKKKNRILFLFVCGGPSPKTTTTHNVDKHGDKDGARDSRAVLRVLDAADELLVVVFERPAEDGQDDDGEDGDDEAIIFFFVG